VQKFSEHRVAIATARAGNVIGGGDWSLDRLIPDLIRGFSAGTTVEIRRPRAIRPWQHVLDPLHGYISLAEKLLGEDGARYATAFNFGPADEDARQVSWIAARMAEAWGDGAMWTVNEDSGAHEAEHLKLDASRARNELGWSPHLALSDALVWLVRWYRSQLAGEEMRAYTLNQITEYNSLNQGSTSFRSDLRQVF
jgi:CDP-glucose 4,6-dehydratase